MKWADSEELRNFNEGGQPDDGNEGSVSDINRTEVTQTEVTHHVAKKTQLATITSIINDFGAINFLMHFNTFLQNNQFSTVATNSTCFPIYKCVTLKLPPISEVSSHAIVDTVHCTKAIPQSVTPRGIKKGASARFSTVLVRMKRADPTLGPMDGERLFIFPLQVSANSHVYLISKGLKWRKYN